MKSIVLTLLLTFVFLGFTKEANAEGCQFICHPEAKKGEEVWFRSILSLKKKPEKATLSISTTGYVLAYINGRNASTATLWPYRHEKKQGIASQELDITGFLTQGSNIIAIWYAPCLSPFYDHTSHNWQISPYITTIIDGKENRHCDKDSNWICCIAPAQITEKGENFDALRYDSEWKMQDSLSSSSWICSEKSSINHPFLGYLDDISLRASNTVEPILIYQGHNTVRCYFTHEIEGQIRLTLRETQRGQKISVNGMEYRCVGINDEQFFTRFTTVKTSLIEIISTDGRKLPDVMNAEIIELKPSDESPKSTIYH